MTRWHVTGAECVAIWPVTVPKPGMHNHREVAMLALPAEGSLNPYKKVQEDEDVEVALYDSVDLVLSMMMREINTPSTMLDSSMSHSNLYNLWVSLLRWKMKNQQKTKKVLR